MGEGEILIWMGLSTSVDRESSRRPSVELRLTLDKEVLHDLCPSIHIPRRIEAKPGFQPPRFPRRTALR